MNTLPDVLVDEDVTSKARQLEAIMLRISMITRRRLARIMATFDLTAPQYMALSVIKRRGDCTMSELAEATYQVSATMTGIISRLEERNLVERSRDPSDRRALRVSLTRQGQATLREVEAIKQAQFLDAFTQLNPEDRQAMLRLMQLYLEASESITEED